MTYLKSALQQQPRNAMAIHLLALQHAELGLIKRAVEGLETALALEPRMETARFQLGLLLSDSNLSSEAKKHFSMLGNSADSALKLYAEAMVALIDGNVAVAREKIASGLSQQSANPGLSALMKRLLDQLAKKNQANGEDKPSADAQQVNQVFLGSYRNTSAS